MTSSAARTKIYRLGGRFFRVRIDRPEASASVLHEGRWVWAPVPSSSIIRNPHAHEVSPEELAAFPPS